MTCGYTLEGCAAARAGAVATCSGAVHRDLGALTLVQLAAYVTARMLHLRILTKGTELILVVLLIFIIHF